MDPLRILFLWEGLDLGGAERYLVRKVAWFRARGHIAWVASSGGELLDEILATGAEHLPIPTVGQRVAAPRLLDALHDASRLDELVERERIDIIDSVAVKPFLFGAPIRRRRGVPLILEALSPCHLVPRVARDEIAATFDTGDVVALEEGLGHLYKAYGIDTRRTRVIPNFADTGVFRPPSPAVRTATREAFGATARERVVLSVSRLDRDKAPYVERLIDEFPAISARCPSARLVIAGDGSEAARLAERAHASLGGRARCLPGTRRVEEVATWYGAADVVVGMGTTVLEAAACAVAVVVANQFFMTPSRIPAAGAGAAGLFAAEGYDGIGHPGPLPTSFAERIVPLLEDDRARAAAAARGEGLVARRFSTDAVMSQWEVLFDQRRKRIVAPAADAVEALSLRSFIP